MIKKKKNKVIILLLFISALQRSGGVGQRHSF